MMKTTTATKIATFQSIYANALIASLDFHRLDTTKFPCWSTLKKYGVVKYDHSEYLEYNDESGVVIEIRYYRVRG